MPSVLKAEHDANAFAKAWTVSEKVAIAKAIEEEMVDRQGKRADLELVAKWPQVKGRRTRADMELVKKFSQVEGKKMPMQPCCSYCCGYGTFGKFAEG